MDDLRSRFEPGRKPNFLNTFNIAVFSGNTSAISSLSPPSPGEPDDA
jgi:hypothetical protein